MPDRRLEREDARDADLVEAWRLALCDVMALLMTQQA